MSHVDAIAHPHDPIELRWVVIQRPGKLENGSMQRADVLRVDVPELTSAQAPVVVHCYVSPKTLRELAEDGGEAVRATFERLLPTKAGLRSGDFGEMVTISALEGREAPLVFPLPRWRLRPTNDATVMGVDLLGYLLADANTPSPDDLLVLCEVKTRSTRANRKIVRVAFDQVKRDYATRVANQLLFQQMNLRNLGLGQQADRLTRFRNPHAALVPYRKRIVASVVHDSSLWKDEFLDELPVSHRLEADIEVEVALLVVEELPTWIAEMRSAAIDASEACTSGQCASDNDPNGASHN